MTQPLVTAEQRAQLLAVGAARTAGRSIDPMPAVRLFTPDAHATWLLAALDPDDGDTAWGLIDLGIGLPTLGTVKLSDLASIVGPSQRRDGEHARLEQLARDERAVRWIAEAQREVVSVRRPHLSPLCERCCDVRSLAIGAADVEQGGGVVEAVGGVAIGQ
jgi:hypothetical protein